jgi:hypothetical protein
VQTQLVNGLLEDLPQDVRFLPSKGKCFRNSIILTINSIILTIKKNSVELKFQRHFYHRSCVMFVKKFKPFRSMLFYISTKLFVFQQVIIVH